MKSLLFLLLYIPCQLWAQTDPFQFTRPDTLKSIGSDLIPTYGRYGYGSRTQYTYDGLDIKAIRLKPYILASGDVNAIREFQAYQNSRQIGGLMIGGGIVTMIVGTITMISNKPNSDGKFTTTQYLTPSPGIRYIGGNTVIVPDKPRQNAYAAGYLTLLGGVILAGTGWRMQLPGSHLRHSVQYYNRAIRQGRVAWEVTPGATFKGGGIRLVGRF